MHRVSRNALIPVLCFLLAVLTLRVFLPVIDEPDFKERISRILTLKTEFVSPAASFVSHEMKEAGIDVWLSCGLDYSMPSLTQKLESRCADHSGSLFLPRFLFVFLSSFPLLLVLAFRERLENLLGGSNLLNRCEYRKRLDAITLSIFMPSTLYFLGLFSFETVFMASSLLILLSVNKLSIFILLISFLALHDIQNVIVLLLFISLIKFFNSKYILTNRWIAYAVGVILVGVAYFHGDSIRNLYYLFSNDSKILQIVQVMDEQGEDKYHVLLRPGITLLSLIFMTAHGFKAWSAFGFIFGFVSCWVINTFIQKVRGEADISKQSFAEKSLIRIEPWTIPLAIVSFTWFICVMLPTYAFGKYYLFLLPFCFYFINSFFSRKMVFFGLILTNLLVLVDISIAYL